MKSIAFTLAFLFSALIQVQAAEVQQSNASLDIYSNESAFDLYGVELEDKASGCYNTGPNCVVIDSHRFGDNDKLIIVLKNNCSGRVYTEFCFSRTGGRSDNCYASGIRKGGTHTFSSANSDGNVSWKWVGSHNASEDWTCM